LDGRSLGLAQLFRLSVAAFSLPAGADVMRNGFDIIGCSSNAHLAKEQIKHANEFRQKWEDDIQKNDIQRQGQENDARSKR
jgi:hypothetical protein